MFVNRRNFYLHNYPYLSTYTQAQIQQYRDNALATRAKLQAYREAVFDAQLQQVRSDGVAYVGGAMLDSTCGSPAVSSAQQEFIPYGHVSRPGSTPQNYSLWGSTEGSRTDSEEHLYRKNFGRSLCRVVTICGVLLVILALLGIVGIAVYLGYITNQDEGPNYTSKYVGNFEVLQGDSWAHDLTNTSSPSFRAKAFKYKNMLESVYKHSKLGTALEKAEIKKFERIQTTANGIKISFSLNLDRRKIPFWRLQDTAGDLIKILEQEIRSASPVAFQNVDVNINDLTIKKVESKSKAQQYEDNSKEQLELVTVGAASAILRVKSSDVNRIKDFEQLLESSGEFETTKLTTVQLTTTSSPATTITTTSDRSSTVSNLIYEFGPWKPVNPSIRFESDHTNSPLRPVTMEETSIDLSDFGEIPVIDGIRDYDEYYYDSYNDKESKNETVMFFPPLPPLIKTEIRLDPPKMTIHASKTKTPPLKTDTHLPKITTLSPRTTTHAQRISTYPSTKPVTSIPSSSTFTEAPKEEKQLMSIDVVREFLRTLFASQTTPIPTEPVNRVGFYPTTTESGPIENVIEEANPSKEDIQAVLENLLFLATIKPGHFSEEQNQLISSDLEAKTDSKENIRVENKSKNEIETSVQSTTQKPLPDFVYVTSYSGVKKPTIKPTGPLPLDRFRIKAQHAATNSPQLSNKLKFSKFSRFDGFNIWDILTTRKPLILDTEVITSTSVNIRYGNTMEALTPVYIHSSTISNLNSILNGNQQNNNYLTIPLISGNKVRYIKVNRTRPNYPNVVVVNIPSDTSRDFKGAKLNSKFLNDLTKLLSQFNIRKSEFADSKTNNREGKLIDILKYSSEKSEKVMNSLWFILSTLRKVYMSDPAIVEELNKFATSNLGQSYLLNKPEDKQKEYKKKRGKSFKLKPITTLFITKGDKDRDAKVLSIAGESSRTLHSATNSPIHTFTFKEGQSLENLLTEIFDALSKETDIDDTNSSNAESNIGSEFDKDTTHEFDLSSSKVPVGEDALKIIEELSKLLSNQYDNYNMVFGSHDEDRELLEETTESQFFADEVIVAITPPPIFNDSIATNEVDATNQFLNKFQNSTKTSYFKYYHDLFPVMTRPMNPIKTTSPTPSTDSSFNVSYSIKSESFENFLNDNKKSKNCTSNQLRCSSGKCIPLIARCNMVRDCPDNSDEANCKCSDILKGQQYSRKICDGIIDCWDNSDENNCEWCSPGQFICTGEKMCVDPEKVCDAVSDCSNGDDEKDCVTIAPNLIDTENKNYFDEGYLMVRQKGLWGKLCVDNFENTISKASVSWSISDLGEAVCNTLSYDSSSVVKRMRDPTPPISRSAESSYYEVDITRDLPIERSRIRRFSNLSNFNVGSSKRIFSSRNDRSPAALLEYLQSETRRRKRDTNNDLTLQFKSTDCRDKDVVKIKCDNLQCGVQRRTVTRQARIVGGNSSSPGAWPWHAALYKEGEYQCGATLITERWLISAGHCFYGAKKDYWVARMGALRRGTKFPSPFEQVRSISHIFIHPEYVNQGFVNDITMLRIAKPIFLNDYVRPICLPKPGSEVGDGQSCTLVGWGQLSEDRKVFPDTLQEVEVPLISTKQCREKTLFIPLYRITENMFCAGYDRGGRDACLGDSGGPLMCQKSDSRWEMVGVTSNGYGCARPHRPGVYTKVANYLSWIDQVMMYTRNQNVIQIKNQCQGHRCPLGHCLPPSQICNGRIECSDGSDETKCP